MAIEREWRLRPPADKEKADRLATELGIDRVLSELLVDRGIETFDQARAFFKPDLKNLHDPFLMRDMDTAVDRVYTAIKGNEKILVYGDYDVDGTTAVALVYSFIKKLTDNVCFYIPDRYEEGYGVTKQGLDWAIENNVHLIITLDCGIKAKEQTQYANQHGIDVIICDHHLPEDKLPEAVAILDPKREDCDYPFDDLSGCGVGFKLVQGLAQKYGISFDTLIPLLDLLVVSIASDLVKITDENRILAHCGLKVLNKSPRSGLKSIISISKLSPGHIDIDDIVFKIGPRINAAGRMDTGSLAVSLLTEEDPIKATEIARQINENNNKRKEIDKRITKEALCMAKDKKCNAWKDVTIVYDPNWNKGVIGIVASRLVEAFYKPAIVLTKSKGFITGSARSVTGFDLYAAIESCADLLENFGGHVYAAGLTMKEEHLKEFCERIEKFVRENISETVTTPIIDIDSNLEFTQITPKFFRILKQFQPFGPGNNNPVFKTNDVYDAGNGRKVGAGGLHLKLDLIQEAQPYHQISAIAFNMSDFYDHIKSGNPIDTCYSIVENYYRGNSSLQLRICDMRRRKEEIWE